MIFPILYGKTKASTIKTWEISVEGSVITTSSGALNGKMIVKVSPPCVGKQKRTDEEQAMFEAKAKFKKKIDDSYAECIEDIPESRKPPKAHKFYEYEDKFVEGSLASIKYNGLNLSTYPRGKSTEVIFQSRGDTEYPRIPDIEKELNSRFFSKYPDATLIGESYAHGNWLEDITSWTKKTYPESDLLTYQIFNVCFPEHPDMGYKDRMQLLRETMEEDKGGDRATVVELTKMNTREEYDAFHWWCVENGYEGSMLHTADHVFVFKDRSTDILKRKEDIDFEFQIIGMEKDKNGNAVLVCLLPDEERPNALSTDISGANHKNRILAEAYYAEHGSWAKAKAKHGVFKVCKKGNEAKTGMKAHDERKYMLDHPEEFIGKWINVHMETWSKIGVPLKPVGHYLRECDSDGKPLE